MVDLPNWILTYRRLLSQTACLGIEMAGCKGPIAVLGIYRPGKTGGEVLQLIAGKSLTRETLREALRDVKLVITCHESQHGVHRIRTEFPGCLPEDAANLDLYLIAKLHRKRMRLEAPTDRSQILDPDWHQHRKKAVTKWRRYVSKFDHGALHDLLETNRTDATNLATLADALAAKISRAEVGRRRPTVQP